MHLMAFEISNKDKIQSPPLRYPLTSPSSLSCARSWSLFADSVFSFSLSLQNGQDLNPYPYSDFCLNQDSYNQNRIRKRDFITIKSTYHQDLDPEGKVNLISCITNFAVISDKTVFPRTKTTCWKETRKPHFSIG